MNIGDILRLEIISYNFDGMGVAKENEYVFFIPFALSGEIVNAKIEKIKKNVIWCSIVNIEKKSVSRKKSCCPYFYDCGGCAFLNADYEEQKKFKIQKVNDALKRIGKIDFKVSDILCDDENIYRYRNKAIITVGYDENKNIVCGFLKGKSNKLIDIKDCLLLPKEVSLICDKVKEFMEEYNISPYDKKTKKGTVKKIYYRMSKLTGEIMAGIVSSKKNIKNEKEFISKILESSDKIKSVILNYSDNDYFQTGNETRILYGKEYIEDEILNKKFEMGSLSFYQVNPYNVDKLYSKAIDYLDLNKSDNLLDIFSGIGTIGICSAEYVNEVVGIEYVKEAVKFANHNVKLNNLSNAKFYSGKAEEKIYEIIKNNNNFNKVILDPPRNGCDKELLKALKELSPERICYVSCDPATLARDVNILTSYGYIVKDACTFDMFPNTYHIESVLLLYKEK